MQHHATLSCFEAMSLSDAWLGEGDAAAGEAQEEAKLSPVFQVKTSGPSKHCTKFFNLDFPQFVGIMPDHRKPPAGIFACRFAVVT